MPWRLLRSGEGTRACKRRDRAGSKSQTRHRAPGPPPPGAAPPSPQLRDRRPPGVRASPASRSPCGGVLPGPGAHSPDGGTKCRNVPGSGGAQATARRAGLRCRRRRLRVAAPGRFQATETPSAPPRPGPPRPGLSAPAWERYPSEASRPGGAAAAGKAGGGAAPRSPGGRPPLAGGKGAGAVPDSPLRGRRNGGPTRLLGRSGARVSFCGQGQRVFDGGIEKA